MIVDVAVGQSTHCTAKTTAKTSGSSKTTTKAAVTTKPTTANANTDRSLVHSSVVVVCALALNAINRHIQDCLLLFVCTSATSTPSAATAATASSTSSTGECVGFEVHVEAEDGGDGSEHRTLTSVLQTSEGEAGR
jgi:hypothetical protein